MYTMYLDHIQPLSRSPNMSPSQLQVLPHSMYPQVSFVLPIYALVWDYLLGYGRSTLTIPKEK